MHLLRDCGDAASLLPPPRYKPFEGEKPRGTQQGLHGRLRSLQTAPGELGSAQLVLSAKPPSARFPINILLLLRASSFASQNAEPCSPALQLQPHVHPSALPMPQNVPPALGCHGEQSMRVAIRQVRLHHPPPSPDPGPLPHTHPLPHRRLQRQSARAGSLVALLLVMVVAGGRRFFHLLLVVGIVMGAGTFSGHVLLCIQVDVEQGSLVARLLPTSLAATVKYLLHQLVHPGDLIVAWTVQCHLGRRVRTQ